jgi:hypothetical protein
MSKCRSICERLHRRRMPLRKKLRRPSLAPHKVAPPYTPEGRRKTFDWLGKGKITRQTDFEHRILLDLSASSCCKENMLGTVTPVEFLAVIGGVCSLLMVGGSLYFLYKGIVTLQEKRPC